MQPRRLMLLHYKAIPLLLRHLWRRLRRVLKPPLPLIFLESHISLCPSLSPWVVCSFWPARNCNKLQAQSHEPRANSDMLVRSSKLIANQ